MDATNVVTPVVSVITSLSYDHTFILGNTIEEIAREKAGIIKYGVPVVLAPQVEEARQVIQQVSVERSAPLYQVGTDIKFAAQSYTLQGTSLITWRDAAASAEVAAGDQDNILSIEPVSLHIPLLGEHQVENAAVAFTTLEIFSQKGLPISTRNIQEGFSQTQWPGRFEILSTQPTVILDCAHNRDSAMRLRLALEAYFPGRPVQLVFGASEDKDIEGRAAEYRDNETGLHIVRMSKISELLGLACGMDAYDCDLLLNASPMHDISKIGIPDRILLKPGKLDPEEWDIMKTHTTIGGSILSGNDSELLVMAREIALSHHEKWDGSGYPHRLEGEAIPLVGRVVAVADEFDALTSERPYKKPWSVEDAVTFMNKQQGQHFDPCVMRHFNEILPEIIGIKDEYPEPRHVA